jgi:DNA-binding response OmpR family regulator
VANILLVEDDLQIRGLLLRVLAREHHTGDVATNGDEALQRIEEREYAAIVLDLMLPTKTGIDVIEHLRVSRPELLPRIIVITASQPAMKHPPPGIGGFFAKPFDLPEFTRAITRVVGSVG